MYYGQDNDFFDRYREYVIQYVKDNNIDIKGKDHWQCGIFSGNTFVHIYRLFQKHNVLPDRIFALDSFKGLPKEIEGIDRNPVWNENEFSSQYLFGTTNNNEIIEAIMHRIENKNIPVEFIEGFYSDSLNQDFIRNKNPKPIWWLDLDIDLCRSTLDVLDFVYANNLLVPGSIISYDDWDTINPYNGGECLAHNQMTEKYKVTYDHIKIAHDTGIFIVKSIGV